MLYCSFSWLLLYLRNENPVVDYQLKSSLHSHIGVNCGAWSWSFPGCRLHWLTILTLYVLCRIVGAVSIELVPECFHSARLLLLVHDRPFALLLFCFFNLNHLLTIIMLLMQESFCLMSVFHPQACINRFGHADLCNLDCWLDLWLSWTCTTNSNTQFLNKRGTNSCWSHLRYQV